MCNWKRLVTKHRGQAANGLKLLRRIGIRMLAFFSEVRGLWTTSVFFYFAGLYSQQ